MIKLREQTRLPDRILLIGIEGIGKTTFGLSAPKPIFLDLEDGARKFNAASLDVPMTLDGVMSALRTLDTQHDYKTLVIDTADALDAIIIAGVCRARGWADIETPGYGKGYTAACDEWRKILSALERLRARGMEVIITCHAKIQNFANPRGEDYMRYAPKLSRGAAELIKEWCDTVLFATNEDLTTKRNDKTKATAGERVLYTTRHPTYDAKNRDGLPEVLPLDYAAFDAARQPKDLAALQAEVSSLMVGDEKAKMFVEAHWTNPTQLRRAIQRLKELNHAKS